MPSNERKLGCVAQLKLTSNKWPNYGGHGISGIEDENGPGHGRVEETTNDSLGLQQVESASWAPLGGKNSALIFLSSVSWRFLPSGGRAEVSVDVGLSLFTGSEAARDNAGSGDEFPQRFFIGIGNHKTFGRTFCPAGLDHCVLCTRWIGQTSHDVTLSPLVPQRPSTHKV